MSVNPRQPDGNAVDRLRSRFEVIAETTAEQRALVEQLETVLEILDQPVSSTVAPRAHHPSARGRQAAKSKQDKLQAALSQLLVEQQQRQQFAQELAVAQETIQHLIELVARRDKQLVSARHAWDLLKSRSRLAAEELSDRVKQLESKTERLVAIQRELEAQLGQAQHDTVCSHNEQTAAAQQITHASEFATSLEQQLAGAREEALRLAAQRDDLQHELQRIACGQRSTIDAAREREVILVQQLEEVQLLLRREQEDRHRSEQNRQAAVCQRDEAFQQLDATRRQQQDDKIRSQWDKAQSTDGVQALKAELQQLHVDRFATNAFIERMIQENEVNQKLAQQRQYELSQACAAATLASEKKESCIAVLQSELESLRREFDIAVANQSARVADHDRITSELRIERDRQCSDYATRDAAKEAEIAKLRSGMQRATIMLESQRRQLSEAEQRLANEQTVGKEKESLYEKQEKQISELQSKIDSLQTSLQREAAARRKAESRVKAAGEEGSEKLTLEDAMQRIDQLSGELAAFRKLAKTLKQKGSHRIRSARAEIARLKAQIESLSARQVE